MVQSNATPSNTTAAVANPAGNGRNGVPAKAEPTRYYEMDALDVIPARWAGELSRELRMRNALRDLTREAPQLIFTDAEADAAGVTPADLGELPELSVDQVASLRRKAVLQRVIDHRELGDDARAVEAERRAAELPQPELFIPREYTGANDPYLVEGLIRGGSPGLHALIAAQRKAGKSTLTDELVYSLVSGEPFCGALETNLPEGTPVIVIDTEMPDADIHQTYIRSRPFLDSGRVQLWRLMGIAGVLNPVSEQLRRTWHQRIPEGAVVVIDCLSPLLGAANIEENHSDVAKFLDGLAALAVERRAGISVVHHMGKDDDKGARGYSGIEAKFSSVIHLTVSGGGMPTCSTTRHIEAIGRGVSFERRRITRAGDGRLVMDGAAGVEAVAPRPTRSPQLRERDEEVFAVLSMHPAETLASIVSRGQGWTPDKVRDSLTELKKQHRAVNLGNGGAAAWVAQWVRDPMLDLDGTFTCENANGLAVVGSPVHEAAVRRRVAEICALVASDPAQANLTVSEMFQTLSQAGVPRSIHTAAYHRWEEARREAGQVVTDPAAVPGVDTPAWSRGLDGVSVVAPQP